MRFTDRLTEAGIEPSIGTVGDAHDNSLAESINGLYKTELTKPGKPWRDAVHVETETAAYLRWFNYDRLYEYCGDIPPVKLERNFYVQPATSGSVSSIKVMSPDLPGWFTVNSRFIWLWLKFRQADRVVLMRPSGGPFSARRLPRRWAWRYRAPSPCARPTAPTGCRGLT